MIFDTQNSAFDEIMGNGRKYFVPKFQRDYAWDMEQWEDLWDDLELLEKDEVHYMGYLVLQPGQNNKQSLKIIDGQQRLTTISILIIAAMKKLQGLIEAGIEPDDSRLKAITRRFIGVENITTMKTEPKLTLNRNNEFHFKNYIASLGKSPGRKLKASNKKLDGALDYFYKKLDGRNLGTGEKIGEFIEENVGRLFFTIITVDGDLNAYKVFETLNARGVQLSVPDLLKNYMFSVIDNAEEGDRIEMDDLETNWEEILSQLGSYSFTKFIKTDWDSRNNSLKETQLFKHIKRKIDNDASGAFRYLMQLRDSAGIYAALHNPKDEFWQTEQFDKAIGHLKALKVFGVTQQNGLLLAAYKKFESSPDKFVKVLGYLAVMAVRYNLIGGNLPSAQERVYNKIAMGIHQGTVRNLEGIKQQIKDIYPDDQQFLSDLGRKKFTNVAAKKVRLFLTALEGYNGGMDLNDEGMTLEHILPQNPEKGWEHISDDALEQYVWRLGNLTILQKSANKTLGNKPFAEKKMVLKSSSLMMNQNCALSYEWNENTIENHQLWLAEIAVKCWKIEF